MGFWSSTFGGGNSFEESVANTFTPNDGYAYERGDLIDSDGQVVAKDDPRRGGVNNLGSADNSDTNRGAYESRPSVTPAGTNNNGSSTDRPVTGIQSLLPAIGGAFLGPVGVAAGLAYNRYGVPQAESQPTGDGNSSVPVGNTPRLNLQGKPTKTWYNPDDVTSGSGRNVLGRIGRNYTNDARAEGEDFDQSRIQGAFYKKNADGDTDYSKAFKVGRFGQSYEVDTVGQNIGNSLQNRLDMAGGDNDGIAGLQYAPRTQATAPTNTMPAASAMSLEAAAGANMPIPDPNYDPTDPMSQKYIVNPTYEQIVAYKKTLLTGMARGGEVESALGGNEKDLINDAEKAIRGELDETRASIILAQYVQQYGEDALRDLVDSIRTGKADDTRERFARGDNGMVLGNGDGSGVDDKVTAQLKDGDATQDILLADGEFVMRKDATDSLQKAYGGGMLDKINDAGPNAATALKKYMTA